jgi:ATP-dependent Clp protease adaptor protein ClpS
MSQQKQEKAVWEAPASGTTVQDAPRTRPTPTERKPRHLPPYRVLLHNDDVNTFEHVIRAILNLTTLNPQEALLRAIEADATGVSLLLVTHRERAELYVEQFQTYELTVTIEPDEP